MVGINFSGTGNSRYILQQFCEEYEQGTKLFSIEDDRAAEAVKNEEMIAFSYPVQYSTVPNTVRDYISDNKELWNGKKKYL